MGRVASGAAMAPMLAGRAGPPPQQVWALWLFLAAAQRIQLALAPK